MPRRSRTWLSGRIAVAALILGSGTLLEADGATYARNSGTTGAFSDTSLYTPSGVLPGAGDTVTSDGLGTSINFTDTDGNITLATLSLNVTSGATIFSQSGGTLSLTTLNFGGGGASRNPVYNFSAGTLNVANAFNWGNGSAATFNVNGGTVNYSGAALTVGLASGARGSINISSGTFNANSLTSMSLGNSGNATGTLNLSGTGIFSANSVLQINVANNANADGSAGTISLSGSSQFNATSATLSVGQFGSSTTAVGTLNIAETASVRTAFISIGGNNATNAGYGVVNLNGGTVTTGSIRLGIGASGTPSATRNVINANGGTVVASSSVNSGDFFAGAFVNVAAGGLKFDTNSNAVGISNAMTGFGGVTKLGQGTLTLSGFSSYSGSTDVNAGELLVNGGITGAVNVASGALLGGSGGTLGATTVLGGGTLSPGASSIGALNFSSLTLGGTALLEINKAEFGASVDFVNVAGALTLGGNLTLLASGLSLTNGDTFNLFDAASFSGKFSSLTLPQLDSGLAWNTSQLAIDGTIAVVPEPASGALLALSGCALLGRFRNRRSR